MIIDNLTLVALALTLAVSLFLLFSNATKKR
jgi:hypothetical protein